jgi:hypothetical protein
LEKLDEKTILKLYGIYAKEAQLERLRDFKKDGVTKRFPMATFFTSVPEENEEEDPIQRTFQTSSINKYINEKLKKTERERDQRVIQHICEKKDITTKKILNIEETVGNRDKKN